MVAPVNVFAVAVVSCCFAYCGATSRLKMLRHQWENLLKLQVRKISTNIVLREIPFLLFSVNVTYSYHRVIMPLYRVQNELVFNS